MNVNAVNATMANLITSSPKNSKKYLNFLTVST